MTHLLATVSLLVALVATSSAVPMSRKDSAILQSLLNRATEQEVDMARLQNFADMAKAYLKNCARGFLSEDQPSAAIAQYYGGGEENLAAAQFDGGDVEKFCAEVRPPLVEFLRSAVSSPDGPQELAAVVRQQRFKPGKIVKKLLGGFLG